MIVRMTWQEVEAIENSIDDTHKHTHAHMHTLMSGDNYNKAHCSLMVMPVIILQLVKCVCSILSVLST